MSDWLVTNREILTLASNLGMMAIWLIYLHLFLVSFRRQSRSVLHISRAAAEDRRGRCLVTNMGAQHIYLLAVIVDIDGEGGTGRALVTDREEFGQEEFDDLLQRTLQGPLGPGEARDIGSFENLARRAQLRGGIGFDLSRCSAMTVTVVAAPNQVRDLVGAWKRFAIRDVSPVEDQRFVPDTLLSPQIRGPFRRRKLAALIEER